MKSKNKKVLLLTAVGILALSQVAPSTVQAAEEQTFNLTHSNSVQNIQNLNEQKSYLPYETGGQGRSVVITYAPLPGSGAIGRFLGGVGDIISRIRYHHNPPRPRHHG